MMISSMEKILRQKPILLQLVGSQKKLGTGSDYDYRGFFLEGPRFERHDKVEINGILCDIDLWSSWYSEKQILKGLNSCPLLYSCLFGEGYEVLTEEGQSLINRRDEFRSRKLIDGCIRFCDRKIAQSKRPNQKLHRGKYIYYAITDMWEQIEILETKDCLYPLRFNDWEMNLILDLKDNKKTEEGLEYYNVLKNKIQLIQI